MLVCSGGKVIGEHPCCTSTAEVPNTVAAGQEEHLSDFGLAVAGGRQYRLVEPRANASSAAADGIVPVPATPAEPRATLVAETWTARQLGTGAGSLLLSRGGWC